MTSLLLFIIVLSLLVFAHELGHFVAAKRAGVRVDEFGFGFPPRLFGVKRGETTYSINWIPLGGFVKIKGESGEGRGEPDSFASKGLVRRSVIIVAGVVMNLVLAWGLLTVGYIFGLPQVAEELPAGARVTGLKVRVLSVIDDSPAASAGLKTGDAIVAFDGAPVPDIDTFRSYAEAGEGETVRLAIERGEETFEVTAEPRLLAKTGKPGIGVALVKTGLISYPAHLAPLRGFEATVSLTSGVVTSLASIFKNFVVTRQMTAEFSGPVGIAALTSEAARLGFAHLIQFTALLSVNLAVINVLPFPALDGGRLLFLFIERVRGHAVSRRLEAAAHNIGFVVLLLLVLAITYKDIVRLGN